MRGLTTQSTEEESTHSNVSGGTLPVRPATMSAPLLFLAQRIPFPPTKGEKIRHLHILQHLRQRFSVHLGCLVDDPLDLQHVPAVQAMCSSAYFGRLDRRRAKLACLRGLLTGEPLSVTFYRHAGLAQWVRGVLRHVRPRVVFVCSSNMAPYILAAAPDGATRIVDLADVDSEKWRAYAEAGSFPMAQVHAREWRLTAQLEARIARECDWSTFVSSAEAALFNRLLPGHEAKVRAISNGVDHGYFDPAHPSGPPFEDGFNVVFTGTMDYKPNVDAVTWFARSVLPILRQTAADARFHIVGATPAAEVTALTALPGVFVTGRVPDTRPYMAHATVCVAPLLIARGIQNKVLEAMAMARPVVATADAMEGIAALPGRDILVADSPDAFAAACVSASGPAGLSLGAAARRLVVGDYDWAERLRGFDPLLPAAEA